MNREILFRGKRVDNGEWVSGSLVVDLKGLTSIIDYADHKGDAYSWHDVGPETVGQYTGMKDKNGMMIFEGDVVTHHVEYGEGQIRDKIKGFVYYVKGEYLISDMVYDMDGGRFQKLAKTVSEFMPEIFSCKIIGNIHDNPELL
jgi:uncharacterized phage protein (TIGR01671 family)